MATAVALLAACGHDPVTPHPSDAGLAVVQTATPTAARAGGHGATGPTGPAAVAAARPDPACPAGWNRAQSGRGVALCTWSGRRGNKTIAETVVLVDLDRGAQVVSLFESAGAATPSRPSPSFSKRSVQDWWTRYGGLTTRFCMQNGAFFTNTVPGTNTTPLSYPLKNAGTLVTAGATASATWKKALVLEARRASIQSYSLATSGYESVANALTSRAAVVGHWHEYNDTRTRDARTYAAVKDGDRNGTAELLMFYASPYASTDEANATLRGTFGAADAMQFDGGGSTQLTCRGRAYTDRSRAVPHVFAIFESPA